MTSWQIIEGDCRDTLRALPAGSVQTCVTSPPYFGLRDYDVDGQIGLEPSPDEFVAALVGVFREVRRVLRDDGTVWLNLGDSYARSWGAQSRGGPPSESSTLRGNGHLGGGPKLQSLSGVQIAAHPKGTRTGSIPPGAEYKPKDLLGIPWMVAFALRADGWYLRSDIIWSKPNPMPESVTDRPTKAHEYVFLLSKSGAPTFWAHAYERRAGVRVKPTPDYWLVPQRGMTGTPHRWDGELFDREQWRRINAWRGHDYFYDADAIREPLADKTFTTFGCKHRPQGNDALGKVKSDNWDSSVAERQPKLNTDGSIAGANKRSVWTVATQPYPGAHFATFPPKLIEPCILTGCPERACGECGAPWTRIVERRGAEVLSSASEYGHSAGRNDGGRSMLVGATSRTVGWQPSCAHDAPTVPGVVLDPFAGAGTTGIVALRHDRSFVGCELSPDYVRMARDRIIADAPLLNSVAEVA